MHGTNEPNIIGNELKYIKESLKKNEIAIGQYHSLFEKKISEKLKSKYSLLCSSGTSALHIALKCLSIKKKQEVIVPSFTFIATVNSIIYNQASPIFMDCDDTCNIDTFKVINFLKKNTFQKNGKCINKTSKKVIHSLIIVHVWGGPANIEAIIDICRKKNIKIIEDASESLFSKYNNGKLKNRYTGTIGDIGCLSFNGNKIITSAGGGAILTSNLELYKRAKYLINQAMDDPFKYLHNDIGYNYRLSNINAAIGLAQFENIKKFIKQKKIIFSQYRKILSKNKNIKILNFPINSSNNYWQSNLLIKTKNYENIIHKISNNLNKINYSIRRAWHPCHLQKPFKNFQKYEINKTIYLAKRLICLPSSSFLNKKEINKIAKVILNSLE